MIGVMYNTGLRYKELLGLQWNEVYANPLDDAEKEICWLKLEKQIARLARQSISSTNQKKD